MLGLLEKVHDPHIVPTLLKVLKWPNPPGGVFDRLAEYHDPAIMNALIDFLDTAPHDYNYVTMIILKEYHSPRVVEAARTYCEGIDYEAKTIALSIISREKSRRDIPLLLAGIQDGHYTPEIVDALGELKVTGAVTPLLGKIARYDLIYGDDTVVACAKALGRIGQPADAPLEAALHSPRRELRMMGAHGLGYTRNPRFITALHTCWTDSEWRVREEAALAIGRLGPTGRRFLLKKLHARAESERKYAACGLQVVKDTGVTSALLRALGDPSSDVRYYTSWSLVDRQESRILLPLLTQGIYYMPGRDDMEEIAHGGVLHDVEMRNLFVDRLSHFGRQALPTLRRASRMKTADKDLVSETIQRIQGAGTAPY